jgi:predicted NUDIX family phosphoesterase
MNQIIQDKMKKEVMVVANTALFTNTERESKVYSSQEADFEKQILGNYEFMVRGEAEENRAYKQPIPYSIVLNEKSEVFVYIRGGAESAAGDTRLHEKLSIGVGGHLEREEEGLQNPLKDGLTRELEEEIGLKSENITDIFPIGYINDDRNEVGEVHIGVSYLVKTQNFSPTMEDGELAHGEFMSYEVLTQLAQSGKYNVETWTELLLPVVKDYI